MPVNLSPIWTGAQFFDATGRVLAGGLINTYTAGTSTPQATYTTTLGTITNSNPIVLGADGRPPAEIWLTSTISYKFVLTDSLSNVIATLDDLKGINDLNNLSIAGTLAVAGNTTLTNLSVTGNTTLGDAAGDGLVVNPSAVNWPNNPTHTGNHTFNGNVTVSGTQTAATQTITGNQTVGGTVAVTGVVTQNANPAGRVTGNSYTPTLNNFLNISASTPRQCLYTRVGPIVSVCGYFTATTTAAGASIVKLSIPVATATFPAANFVGSGAIDVAASNGTFIQGDGLGAVSFQWTAAAGATFNASFSFMYLVT